MNNLSLKFKNLLHWRGLILISLFLLAFLGFLSFEKALILKILMVILILGAGYFLLSQEKFDFLAIIVFYLLLFNLYNFYFVMTWPLWLVMLLLLLFTAGIFYLTNWINIELIDKRLNLVYLLLIALIILEIFLALIPWPTDPKGKAMILATVFYLFTGLVSLKAHQQLDWKKSLSYLAISFLIILAIIITTQWYGY